MLSAGSTISHFEILDKLGEGGMGIVYKARDRLLDRVVAIKVLPSPADATEEQRQRFVREAKSASALNHPNIVTIYEIGTDSEVTFIAMEYVPGHTLHEELRAGRLPLRRALDYSIQLAAALSAAHAIGVIHRDIKPANILISDKGVVKVLDFGLAKLAELSRPPGALDSVTDVTTPMTIPLTGEGAIVGTVSYMSPEQAEGKPVDTRTDIFSFGAVLYEMLTGRLAFAGSTKLSTLAAILTKEPAPIPATSDVPVGVAKLIARCLRKDPSRRIQVMPDVQLALEELRDDIASGDLLPASATSPAPNARNLRWILGLLAAIVLAVGATAAAFTWGLRPRTPPKPTTFSRLTTDSGLTTDPAISPDGKLIAYASDRSGRGDLDIWVQQTAGGAPVRLTNNEANDRQPAFSPDASKVVFRSEREKGGIYVVSSLGGDATRVAQGGFDPQFSPDGQWVAFWTGAQVRTSTPSKIFLVPAAGGAAKEVPTGLPFARHPIWTPDGKHLLYWGASEAFPQMDWFAVEVGPDAVTKPAVSSGAIAYIGPQRFPDFYPLGWIGTRALFAMPLGDTQDLWSIPISYRSGKATGPSQRLTAGLESAEHPSISPTGRIVWAKVETDINVWSLPVDTNTGRVHGEWEQLTTGITPKLRPNLSRNGQRAVFNDGQSIAVLDLATRKETILAAFGMHASLTADGTKVTYVTPRNGIPSDLYVDNLDGDVPEKVCDSCGMPSGGWSTGQQKILYDFGVPQSVGLFDLKTRRKRELLGQKGRAFTQAGFSPDDRWILFLAGAGPGRQQVFIMPFQDDAPIPPEDHWIALTDGRALDSHPRWSPDGRIIYFISNKDGFRCLWARRVDPTTKQPAGEAFAISHLHSARRSIGNIPTVGVIGLGVAQDRVIVNLGTSTGNVWMADFDSSSN